MKRYLPKRIVSIKYGNGWWWGKYLFFIHKNLIVILPCWVHYKECTYENGKKIIASTISWLESEQN